MDLGPDSTLTFDPTNLFSLPVASSAHVFTHLRGIYPIQPHPTSIGDKRVTVDYPGDVQSFAASAAWLDVASCLDGNRGDLDADGDDQGGDNDVAHSADYQPHSVYLRRTLPICDHRLFEPVIDSGRVSC